MFVTQGISKDGKDRKDGADTDPHGRPVRADTQPAIRADARTPNEGRRSDKPARLIFTPVMPMINVGKRTNSPSREPPLSNTHDPPRTPAQSAPPQAPPAPASLVRHMMRYLSASVLGILAGAISYPVMNRKLDNTQWGLLGLFETFALIWVAVLKLGTQNSVQRFYPVYALSADPARRRAYYASLVQAPALISGALCLGALALLPLAGRLWPIQNMRYLVIVLLLGELRVLGGLLENVIRAREHSALAARLNIINKVVQMVLVVAVITLVSPTAMGVYLVNLGLAAGLLIYYIHWGRRHCDFGLRAFSPRIFREGMAYGLPLVWSEISFIMLAFADRLMMIPLGCTYAQVGIYTVGYGLAMMGGDLVMYSMLAAFQPMANRLYETEGREAALALQRQVLRMLYYLAAAVAVGMALVGRDFLILLAGPAKADAVPVFQWIGINYMIYPIFGVMAYGLNLTRKTRVIARIVLGAATLNIALNFLLIPRLGIMGAVYATLACYVVMGAAMIGCCPRDHRPLPSAGDLLKPLALAALMGAAAWGTGMLGARAPAARLAAMAGIFAVTFAAPMLVLEPEMRSKIFKKSRAQ